jgi:geranylgeranyl reductase family protein
MRVRECDVAIVGAGPAGCAAALAVLNAAPRAAVVLLDAVAFPRDKTCGDGIGPDVVDRLAALGVRGVTDGWTPVDRFDVRYEAFVVRRSLSRPMWVIPRRTFDARLVAAATERGATLLRHRVRELRFGVGGVEVDDWLRAQIVIGADGAHSTVRCGIGEAVPAQQALALRGYAAVSPDRAGTQYIAFSGRRHPSYAWSFDRGDGLANVGYGELLDPRVGRPSRASLLESLERLLPGTTKRCQEWRAHHLPLSSWRWSHPPGRVLLAGDAASLVNPLTGEGIYYAVTTGALAGAAASTALAVGDPTSAGIRYRQAVHSTLASHLRHLALARRLFTHPPLIGAGVRAAAHDQRIFDQLMDLGLAQGKLTAGVVQGLMRAW